MKALEIAIGADGRCALLKNHSRRFREGIEKAGFTVAPGETPIIPVMLGEAKSLVEQRLAAGQPAWRNPTEKNGKLVWYSPAIGGDPRLVDVILERVKEAARMEDTASSVLKLGQQRSCPPRNL